MHGVGRVECGVDIPFDDRNSMMSPCDHGMHAVLIGPLRLFDWADQLTSGRAAARARTSVDVVIGGYQNAYLVAMHV